MTAHSYTVGIDFGTSTTLVAEGHAAGRSAVVPIGQSDPWLASVVTTGDAGEFLAGEHAERRSPGTLIRSVKRAITRRQETITSLDGSVTARTDDVISAILVEVAQRSRDNQLDITEEGRVRLGCPAMWDADQRTRLLDLAKKAGFGVGASTLIDEPIAAGLMWINEQHRARRYLDNDRVLIFDMGGGTLDVAILDVTTGPARDPQIYVLASNGVDEAGDKLDETIAEDLESMLADRGVTVADLPQPAVARAYIARAATEVKIALTDSDVADVYFDYRDVDLPRLTYTVGQLDDCLRPQLDRAWRLVESTLRAALLTWEHRTTREDLVTTVGLRAMAMDELLQTVHHVVLVGGMSRIPGVARFLSDRLAASQIHTFSGFTSQEAIATGLAEDVSYEQVNLHLPGFDFVLDIPGRAPITLYRAHTPFYRWWEAQSKMRLSYSWPDGATAHEPAEAGRLPRSGYATLRVVALDGSVVAMRDSNGVQTEGLRVNFGFGNPRFTLAPDGTMGIVDGRGEQQSLRIERWPALRAGHGKLSVRVEKTRWVPDDRRAWDTK
ncbi:Hsp70 family protein [Cellulomonas sp. ATA003]|uniref:Hsp70 family protein n=1 Tax=Cellulomonas sp. ATA003 TaxID=3073064 RepID=UPI002872F0F6|nr:Hsp70 family protein [Cellulomonas sp. ATA003]WNB86466.1 Hsp70 family protein [Cellulomonas sp. ATA003]